MKRNLFFGLLVLFVAACLVAVCSILTPEDDGARGVDHPVYQSMMHGGSGIEKHTDVLWLNWSFGVLGLFIVATLIAIGANKNGKLRGLGPWLALLTAGCFVAWTLLVLFYRDFMVGGSRDLFFSFPQPSAVMFYVLLPLLGLLTLVYVIGFPRWILTEEDLATYEELLAARKRSAENPDGRDAGGN